MQSEGVNPKPPDRPLQVEEVEAADLSASAGDGVKWAGEHDALARRHEKDAFFSRLVALGYIPHQFRVTVRHVTSEGDTRQRYTVLVAQLRDGVPYRGKRYVGGDGAEWVNDFYRDALTNFPRNIDAVWASNVAQLNAQERARLRRSRRSGVGRALPIAYG